MPPISAHSIKSSGRGLQPQQKPREGSKLRIAYDRAMTGDWFHIRDMTGTTNSLIRQLMDYNLEFIRKPDETTAFTTNRGGTLVPGRLYKCIGIWDGSELKTLDDVEVALDNTVMRDDKGLSDGLR